MGGAGNFSKLILSLKQLIRDVNFFAASEDQVKLLLTSEVKGLSALKAEVISKLCQDNMTEWRRNQMECDAELVQSVDWNLKVISCSSDGSVNEPLVQLHFNMTDQTSTAIDADQAGLRSLYNKLEEVQHKLDQIRQSGSYSQSIR